MAGTTRIIGVSGFMRTGKDSVAKLLIETFGYSKVSFADPLRKVAYDIDPYINLKDAPDDVLSDLRALGLIYDDTQLFRYQEFIDNIGYERSKEVPDFRRYLQRLGTEGIRGNFGDSAWVDMAIKAIQKLPEGTNIVLPDVRFPNEAQAIKDMGGVIWRTMRPGFDGGEHPSEAMVLKITPDVVLEADSLMDWEEEVGDSIMAGMSYLKFHQGLGSLVIEELGFNPAKYQATLETWANEVLGASVPA